MNPGVWDLFFYPQALAKEVMSLLIGLNTDRHSKSRCILQFCRDLCGMKFPHRECWTQ